MAAVRGERRRNRAAVLLAAVASAVVIAAACALLVDGEARVKSIPGLAVAVFGTFLTSMAIVAAFSIEEGSRWPTPWEALDRAHVPSWFVVALGSVITALLASAFDNSFLSAFSLTLALAAIPLGTWGLWGLVSLSSDQGRWGLVVDLLAQSILAAGEVRREPSPDLGEIDTEDHVPASFVAAGLMRQPRRTRVALEEVPAVLREYADRRDLGAIVGMIEEVHAGADRAYANSVDALLHVQRQIFAELANRVLSGQLGDATARIALRRAGESAVDAAGRALRAAPEGAAASGIEALVARHLTALARLAGAVAGDAEAILHHGGAVPGTLERSAAQALRTACVELQQAIRWAVDCDPPGMKIPAGHVWQAGLADPESALGWLWSAAESPTGPYGVGLYAVCEILTGRKFLESYWDGFDVLTEIERRLYGPGAAALPGLEAVERAGGLARVALDLAAVRLAALPPRRPDRPHFVGDPVDRDDRHAACELFLAGAGFKPAGRDPLADLAWLLTDRLQGSLWTLVFAQLSELPDDVLEPPLSPLHRRPEACALAVSLRLASLAEPADRDPAALRSFAAALPGSLLQRTAALALELTAGTDVARTADADAPGASRALWEQALVDAASFARHVVPGPLPERSDEPPQEPPRAAPALPLELVGSSYDGALENLAAEAEIEIDLIQCDRRWLDEWTELRAELDVALLAAALSGRARVRRVTLFDLPRDAPERSTRRHYRWMESLTTAVKCLRSEEWDGTPRYEVRRLVFTGSGAEPPLPADRIEIRRPGEASAAEPSFEALWAGLVQEAGANPATGLIEL
jgi:hypothetical protein